MHKMFFIYNIKTHKCPSYAEKHKITAIINEKQYQIVAKKCLKRSTKEVQENVLTRRLPNGNMPIENCILQTIEARFVE